MADLLEGIKQETPQEILSTMCEECRKHNGYVIVILKNSVSGEETLVHPLRIQQEQDGVLQGDAREKFLAWLQSEPIDLIRVVNITPDPKFDNFPPELKLAKTIQKYAEGQGYARYDQPFIGRYVEWWDDAPFMGDPHRNPEQAPPSPGRLLWEQAAGNFRKRE